MCRLFVLFLLSVVLLPVGLAQERGQGRRSVVRIVAQGEGHLVHAVTYSKGSPGEHFSGPAGGVVLIWTSPEEGRTRRLATTGTFAIPTRRISYEFSRLLGLATGEGRLYLATLEGRAWDRSPRMVPVGAEHVLWVFDLASGEQLAKRVIGSLEAEQAA